MALFGMTASYLAFSVVHFIQFVLAITVCGLYGVDLSRAAKAGKYQDSKWIYAVFVGGITAFTTILYMIPFILRFAAVWIWNIVLFILWIALFGVFGNVRGSLNGMALELGNNMTNMAEQMYIHENPEGNGDIQRMKNAVWVNLTSALLWLFTAVAAFGYWWRHRERHSRFTGRAKV